MKTNHEMLKEICDVIGYDLIKNGFDIDTNTLMGGCIIKILNQFQRIGDRDEREIIFTQEFKSTFITYFFNTTGGIGVPPLKGTQIFNNICNHLEAPTLYLYNTLGLGKQKDLEIH